MSTLGFKPLGKFALLLTFIATGVIGALAEQVTVNPTSLAFGTVDVNVVGVARRVTLINHSTTRTYSLTGITFGLPNYGVNTGLPEQTLPPGAQAQFGFIFLATETGTYNTNITFKIEGQPGVVLTVTANVVSTTAQASFSSTSLNFGTVNIGSTVTQSVTVTNNSTADEFTIEKVDDGANQSALNGIYYQPFTETGPIPPTTVNPQGTVTFQITFSPTAVGTTTAPFTLCYDVIPCNTVDLTGVGTMPAAISLTTYPFLPWATQGAAYSAPMTATGGTPPYQYRVSSGTLPTGLSLASSTGVVSGTIASGAATGNYSVTVEVQDSSKPKRQSAFENLTLTLNPATGANCNNTSIDVGGTSTPVLDLIDLGTGTYCPSGATCSSCPFKENCEGGLYPGGSNIDPASHESDGVNLAQEIASTSGQIVMVSLGQSASQQPFEQFITEAKADPQKNPNLIIVDGAEGGETAGTLTNSNSGYWGDLLNYQLPFWTGLNAADAANEVQVVWISDVDSGGTVTFPSDATTLQSNYEAIAQILVTDFPNIKLMFFSSMNYTGYSDGISDTLPEPQAYESGFGAKWAIESQIDGDCCNYNSSSGPVTAPWMGWSAYYWANGMIPRAVDDVTWACQDLEADGLHPRDPIGHIKIAQYLLNFFKNSELTAPWFLVPPAQFERSDFADSR